MEADVPLDSIAPIIRAFAQSEDFRKGCLSVEIETEGKPIAAADFAAAMSASAKLLESLDESKSLKWAIIEANVIGDIASFTLQCYDKQAFKTNPRRKKKEMPDDKGASP